MSFEEEDRQDEMGFKFSPHVSLGQAIQAAAILVAVTVWAATASSKADQTAQDVKDFKTSVTAQMAGMQASLDRGLQSLQQQIASIPTYGARIDQLEKSQAQQDSTISVLDGRLRSVENQTAIDKSRLDNIERASAIPLGKSR